ADDDPRRRADGYDEEDENRSRAVAASVSLLAHAASLRTGRRRAGHGGGHSGGQQELAAVQAPRVRPADRPGRERVPGIPVAVVGLPVDGDAEARTHG